MSRSRFRTPGWTSEVVVESTSRKWWSSKPRLRLRVGGSSERRRCFCVLHGVVRMFRLQFLCVLQHRAGCNHQRNWKTLIQPGGKKWFVPGPGVGFPLRRCGSNRGLRASVAVQGGRESCPRMTVFGECDGYPSNMFFKLQSRSLADLFVNRGAEAIQRDAFN
jgi:hypothetical protein